MLSGEARLESVFVVAEKVLKGRLIAGVGAQRCHYLEKVLGKALGKISRKVRRFSLWELEKNGGVWTLGELKSYNCSSTMNYCF